MERRIVRKRGRITARSMVVAAVGLFVAGSEIGSPGAAWASRRDSPAVPAPAVCHYTVIGDPVHVRSGPGEAFGVVRVKHRGDKLTGPRPCTPTQGYPRYRWFRLYLSNGSTQAYVASHLVGYNGAW